MAAEATVNVRMPEALKRGGDEVFARFGVSVSDAVRGLYQYCEETQKVPDWLMAGDSQDALEARRRTLRDIAGIVELPADFNGNDLKRERLSRYLVGGGSQ